MEKWSGECVGQVRGVLKTRLAVPGHPRRVACLLRRAATGGATWPANSEPVGHDVTERFLKMAIQCLMIMTDSAISSYQHGSTNDPLQKRCS